MIKQEGACPCAPKLRPVCPCKQMEAEVAEMGQCHCHIFRSPDFNEDEYYRKLKEKQRLQ